MQYSNSVTLEFSDPCSDPCFIRGSKSIDPYPNDSCGRVSFPRLGLWFGQGPPRFRRGLQTPPSAGPSMSRRAWRPCHNRYRSRRFGAVLTVAEVVLSDDEGPCSWHCNV